jgi:hypothetical protein
MIAGHNALRGSGPGQQHAFDDAMALMGCPDRRIDRLCITCCLPSQPSHHAGYPTRSRLTRKRCRLFVALALGHHDPGHPRNLVGERDGRDLGRAPRQQRGEPGPMRGAMDLGIGIPSLGRLATASIGVLAATPVGVKAVPNLAHECDGRRQLDLATTIDIWSLLRAAGRALQQLSRSLTSHRIDVRGTASNIRRR